MQLEAEAEAARENSSDEDGIAMADMKTVVKNVRGKINIIKLFFKVTIVCYFIFFFDGSFTQHFAFIQFGLLCQCSAGPALPTWLAVCYVSATYWL